MADHWLDWRYNHVAFKASHNSFDHAKGTLDAQLTWDPERPHHNGCRGLEFDIVQSLDTWRWRVAHMGRYSKKESEQLSAWLGQLREWSDAHPGHDPVTVTIDIKNEPLDQAGFVLEFDEYVDQHLGIGKLFTPGELMGPHDGLVTAVRESGWPALRELRGQFLLVLSGSEARKANYTRTNPRERLCFADRGISQDWVLPDPLFPSRDEGTRVFFNVNSGLTGLGNYLRWYPQQDMFAVRGYYVNSKRRWTDVIDWGVNVVATDKLKRNKWASVAGTGPFVRLRYHEEPPGA